MSRRSSAPLSLSIRLLLRAAAQLEERGPEVAAVAAYRRLRASLSPIDPAAADARRDVAAALVRLGLRARSSVDLEEGCSAWRELGAYAGEREARTRVVARALLRQAILERRTTDAATIAAAEMERSPEHWLVAYARGKLALLEGDVEAGEVLLRRVASAGDRATRARARAVLAVLPDERLPGAGEPLAEGLGIAARVAFARRLSRSAGRYARLRGLDLLLGALPPAPQLVNVDLAGELLAAAAAHVDVVGVRLTDIERDRLRELCRRMPEVSRAQAARIDEAAALRARLAALAPAERVALLVAEGSPALAALARAVRWGAGPWPESDEPHVALAAETLRVVDALRIGAPPTFDRLLALFANAGPTAVLVPTLWALFPAFVSRHASLGDAAERLRPVLAAVLDDGPLRSLDPALLARALDALGEDDLAERAARRAAGEGNGAAFADRLVHRAFRLAASQPAEALRLLERAERIA